MRPTVLITGGGTGIGAAVAKRMAADDWAVCVAGRRDEPLQRVAAEIGGHVVAGADVGQPAGAERAVHGCLERFGGLDALVISSGTGAGGAVGEQTLERWAMVLQTNLTGAFLVCHAAIDALLESRGAIVTVASLAGLHASPESVAYCSSKAGLIMLTKCIALDYAARGIRANCVCPGWIETEMADRAMDELAGDHATDRAGAYELATAAAPARRPGTPEEAAEAVAWLASPAASYVNGAVLTVDGGLSIVDAGTLAFARGSATPGTTTAD
ncbi:MAG TPA: SDR family oxidoreductase [Solirubrobacteraceae bacterium]|nr:SDR family oxidoreductase [Solirubrobacteraceae bacterium]